MKKTKMELKHKDENLTPMQEAIVSDIARTENKPFLEAKEAFLENPDVQLYTRTPVAPVAVQGVKTRAGRDATLEESKLGLTLVLSKEDCARLGFKPSDSLKVIRAEILSKIGLR